MTITALATTLCSSTVWWVKSAEDVRDGEPVEEIKQVVQSEGVDLLVMLAHEEGRLEHFLFGRTNEAILRKMPCSILLVKQS